MFKNNKLERFYWDFRNKFNYYSPIYIRSFNFKKMWREWRNVSNIFLKPSLKFDWAFNKHYHCWMHNNTPWKLFYLYVFPLGWKMKYDDVQFERSPYVILSLFFGLIEMTWTLHAPDGDTLNEHIYWESVLGYQYTYDNDLHKTYKHNIWRSISSDDEQHETRYTLVPYLTYNGCKILEARLQEEVAKIDDIIESLQDSIKEDQTSDQSC